MAARLLHDPEKDGWERSDFPIACETCLGPNPYLRMQRIEYGGTCHISGRPYTVFRWKPGGEDSRYKKTIICQDVAKAKNVCQVCLFDLKYGLPVAVRDRLSGVQDEGLPQSAAGKEFALDRMARDGSLDAARWEEGGAAGTGAAGGDGSAGGLPAGPAVLESLRRNATPYYRRNRAKVCSFWQRGKCTRGAECPYRHEAPEGPQGSMLQNIKDRYYGVNDPVAGKIFSKLESRNGPPRAAEGEGQGSAPGSSAPAGAGGSPPLTPPADRTICTLFLGGLPEAATEADVRDAIYAFGELRSVRALPQRRCAFLTFVSRPVAERAAAAMAAGVNVAGARCRVAWGKPVARGAAGAGGAANGGPSADGGGRSAAPYPSMDPLQAGSRLGEADEAAFAARQAAAEAAEAAPARKRARAGEA